MTANINKAKTIAKIAHAGQTYDDGEIGDFFEKHVEKVVENVALAGGSERDIVVAYLHDVVEDTHVTLVDLHHLGFSTPITEAVDAITRRDEESYASYIERVGKNDIARFVKLCDLRANNNAGTWASLKKRNAYARSRLLELSQA